MLVLQLGVGKSRSSMRSRGQMVIVFLLLARRLRCRTPARTRTRRCARGRRLPWRRTYAGTSRWCRPARGWHPRCGSTTGRWRPASGRHSGPCGFNGGGAAPGGAVLALSTASSSAIDFVFLGQLIEIEEEVLHPLDDLVDGQRIIQYFWCVCHCDLSPLSCNVVLCSSQNQPSRPCTDMIEVPGISQVITAHGASCGCLSA